jgi:hypothetical protein
VRISRLRTERDKIYAVVRVALRKLLFFRSVHCQCLSVFQMACARSTATQCEPGAVTLVRTKSLSSTRLNHILTGIFSPSLKPEEAVGDGCLASLPGGCFIPMRLAQGAASASCPAGLIARWS